VQALDRENDVESNLIQRVQILSIRMLTLYPMQSLMQQRQRGTTQPPWRPFEELNQ